MDKMGSVEENIPVMVTVFCLVYNHEKYVDRMLQSVLSQHTNFKYEVLVHEDASTDGTREILQKYVEQYPEIIVPIYQSENQYSLRTGILRNILLPLARGKYYAFCEGDDYWCDEYKLQKQYEILEKNGDCSICVHKVICCNEDGSSNERIIPEIQYGIKEGKISDSVMSDALWVKGGYPFQTSSYFVRREVFFDKKNAAFMEKFGRDRSTIQASFRIGKFYYKEDAMSCYRLSSFGSWNEKFNTSDIYDKITFWKKDIIERELYFDELTDFHYHAQIEAMVVKNVLGWCAYEPMEAKRILKNMGFKISKKNTYVTKIMRIKCYVLFLFPFMITVIKKMRFQIKKILMIG